MVLTFVARHPFRVKGTKLNIATKKSLKTKAIL